MKGGVKESKMESIKELIMMLQRRRYLGDCTLEYAPEDVKRKISNGEFPIDLEIKFGKSGTSQRDQTIENYLESEGFGLVKFNKRYIGITGASGGSVYGKSNSLVLIGPGKDIDQRQTKLVERQSGRAYSTIDFHQLDVPEIENEELIIHHSGLVEVKYQIKGAKLSRDYALELRAV